MGVTDSKAVSLQIDNEFKSIRKYNDNFYGQITVIQQKSTNKLFALVQKVILKSDNSLNQFLKVRKQFSPYLVRLHEYYSCNVDYCSGLQKYFFLLQYSDHTLYNQMAIRQQSNTKFTSDQLFNIFNSYLQMTSFLKDKNKFFKSFISNHFVLYYSSQELKTLQTLLKVQNDTFEFDFHLIKNKQKTKQLYLAPQAYLLMCNKQRFEAKHISYTQKAIVFMLGMNFIECALLADVSGVYSAYEKRINFDKLQKALQQMSFLYGEEIAQIVSEMVSQNPFDRPSIQELKEYIKTNLKRRKIIIPKHTKIQHLSPKYLHT